MVATLIASLALIILSACTKSGFDLADSNRDGQVNSTEFDNYMLEVIYSAVDADGNSKVTWEETKAADPDAMKENFNKADADGDGAVTPAEAKAYFDKTGGLGDLFEKIDTDNDEKISEAEAVAFRNKLQAQAGPSDLQKLEQAAESTEE